MKKAKIIITIKVISDDFTIAEKRVLKVFKRLFIKRLEKIYGSGYEII